MVSLGIVKLQPTGSERPMSRLSVNVQSVAVCYYTRRSNLYVHAECTCKIQNTEQNKGEKNQVAAL